MKLMKTKLGLSVLALALVGAGAWSLQSPVTASAEVDMSGFKMENGASVCLSGVDVNENEFNGIRWTTTVEPEFYTSAGASLGSEFGVIVAPTSLFDGDLTFDTTLTNGSQVKKLPVKGIDAGSEAKKYYSVIDYSEIGDLDDPSKAYKLELTARAYVDVDGDGDYSDCIYADMTGINTSRSARQVAVSAELAGVVEENDMAKAKEYYGEDENVTANVDFVKNTGAKGTQYIDMVNDTTVDVAITVDGTIEEVLIGSKSVGYEYENGTLTLTGLDDIVCGEQYVTVFTDNGIVTKPIIGATKVIDKIEDFNDFQYIRKNLKENSDGNYKISSNPQAKDVDGNDIDADKLLHDGYYVLANDIENTNGFKLEDYTWTTLHANGDNAGTPITCAGYYGVNDFKSRKVGLTGTFNGMGYAVKDMEIATDQQGIFGVISGGTVKNVAFTDVKSSLTSGAFGLANYLVDATLENVYVKTEEYVENESVGFPMVSSAGIAQYYEGHTTMKSCVVEFSTSSQSMSADYSATTLRASSGVLFSAYRDDYGVDDFTTDEGGNTIVNPNAEDILLCEDVYCISANTYGSSGSYDHMLIYNRGSSVVMGCELDGAHWTSKNTTTGGSHGNRADGVRVKTHSHTVHALKGAYRYNTLTQLKSAGYSFASLTASGCWSVVGNLPVWGS